MTIYDRNRQVFLENRHLSRTKYDKATNSMLNNTKVYTSPSKCNLPTHRGACSISFDSNDTISTALYFSRMGYKVCALNFADALTPGGLVFEGEVTQEEDLCRCSNLYESLVKVDCLDKYYKYNNSLQDARYSDRIIYSKGVSIIRESLNYSLLDKPVKCDILTCPAPIASACGSLASYYSVIKQRIECILKVMASNKVNAIVLGAWGCGAFGGNAFLVGKAFAEVMQANFRCFDKISFSVKSTRNDSSDNLIALRSGFYSILD